MMCWYVWCDSRLVVIDTCGMIYWYVRRHICGVLYSMCDVTREWVRECGWCAAVLRQLLVPFVRVTWLIHICGMTVLSDVQMLLLQGIPM